jgi:predicted nucleotidyltransferase
MPSHLAIDQEQIAAFCRRNRIRRLSLFGSVLRDDFGPASDVDVLVEFRYGYRPGLAFFEMELELESIFQRPVDFLTAGFLGPEVRAGVLAEAQPIYVEG